MNVRLIVTICLSCFLLSGAAWAADDINLARLGMATQSSTCFTSPPENAIDGIFDNFTHTCDVDVGDGSGAWWQVDLQNSFALTSIVIHNRTSCCQSRLRDITVSVLNADGTETFFESDLLNPNNEGYVKPDGPPTLELDLVALTGDPVSGQVVRVLRTPDPLDATEANFVSLGEIEIFGEVSDLAPIILEQPVGGRVAAGDPFTLSVTVLGSEPLSYQWRKDDVDVPGANETTLVFETLTKDDAGTYLVVVTNDIDDVISDPAVLVVPGKNIGPWGTASQSSMASGGLPERAIDNNTDGTFNNGSATHTSPVDPAPWWEVRLAGVSTIESIALWNRVDCCSERLSNFKVSVLDETRGEEYSEEFFTDGIDFVDPLEPLTVELPPNTQGRYVRVELLGPNLGGEQILTLVEVEVFGDGPEAPPDPNANLAFGKPTLQSSLCSAYSSDLAVDGNLGNFTHTCNTDNDATWEVDLGSMEPIGLIVLHNRTSCCGSRLRDITVSILNADGTQVLFESELLNPENELGAFPLGPANLTIDLVVETGGTVTGQIVRVKRAWDDDLSGGGDGSNLDEGNVLSLAEVQVFRPLDCPPAGDSHCEGMTVDEPDDGGMGDYWFAVTVGDDSGDVPYVTFTVDNGRDAPIVTPPARVRGAGFNLGLGEWTITARVDDSIVCPDEAPDAVCTMDLTIAGDPNNVAPLGVATQSTMGWGGVAPRAIDGNTDGVYNNGSITHTAQGDPTPWWEVDLTQTYTLERIVLWNRTDVCCMDRLTNFRVSILDAGRDAVWEDEFFTDGFGFPDTSIEGFEIEVDETAGQYILIEIIGLSPSGEMFLSLAEVEAFKGDGGGEEVFKRGDTNVDGAVNIADAIASLGFLFGGGDALFCPDAADSNDDGTVNIADAIAALGHLFGGDGDLPPPFGACGTDPTDDTLGSCVYPPGNCK